MNDILIGLIIITVLFVLGLFVKRITLWKFCSICIAVSGTWTLLFAGSVLGLYDNQLMIGILMVQSIVGIYYLLEKRLDEWFFIFRLPYILTGTLAVYTATTQAAIWEVSSFLFVASMWALFGGIYLMRTNAHVKNLAKQIIACCRDW